MEDIIATMVSEEGSLSDNNQNSEHGDLSPTANYDSGPDTESPSNDQFNESIPFSRPTMGNRMPAKKDGEHMSFRHRVKKKEMRRGSFTYKQVSDAASPTAHRKQLFSKRSACVLTEQADEEERQGKHVKVNGYHFLKTLGKGAYGEVRLATKDLVEDDFSSHTSRYAIKVMRRSLFEEKKALPFRGRRNTTDSVESSPPSVERSSGSAPLEDLSIPSALLQEINIMKRLAHPNLVKLREIINDDSSKYLFLVLEHMQGGTVMIHDEKTNKYVHALTKQVMLESSARRVFKELASALSYMHANHIAHRDIKPDNLLIDFDGKLKLSDFGVSVHFENDRQKESISMKSLARSTSRGRVQATEGTFNFYSPEMCFTGQSSGYNAYMADLWAAGVCLWIFVFGTVPFQSNDVTELFRIIREDQPPRPHRLSPELDNLLGVMMRKEVERRPSCMDVRHHCWLTETPLDQHAEVIIADLEANAVSSSVLSRTLSSSPPAPSLGKGLKMGVAKKLVAKPLRAISPAVKEKLLAWMQRARKICTARHQAFVLNGQAEMNSLIRKAVQKQNEQDQARVKARTSDDFSDASSDFSMGSANSDDDDDASVVSVTDMLKHSGTAFENVFGRYGDSFDDVDEYEEVMRKRQSAPASVHLAEAVTNERNIFQRGIHKIEKRLLELQKSDSGNKNSADESDEDDEESPRLSGLSPRPRKSLVERGIHKVVKKISFTGANTDKHLQEDAVQQQREGQGQSSSRDVLEEFDTEDAGGGVRFAEMTAEEEEAHLRKPSANFMGWFSRTKTT
mmetsp:Transcript_6586/g.10758  ORF Transcript_6586/g.10758 Transcript_6586/m.10758 type:complete len:794 (-) Transcript_6586:257-2638(-)|eukprot:CAMPEP_0114430276 /NCGR_PEP_ID=MMETSP0103-20121206/9953_1 /TAXON_ID=37642 ORGANISM="Paraphysomonas imperforata, Strain PA2" /NCGR_SAMPLE_ID=MMETSP0103 /ASSEMBLY_ACC=CAM_ASM_000201 /LENGTH=793 /DNA_ID=CAMNT_0001599709 /DNA_START=292 /DNA_END=2673 /DNA_ORIENTATION=+